METDLRDALEQLAERGGRRGASAVVTAAIVDFERSPRSVATPPPRRRWMRRVAATAAAAVVVFAAVGVAGVVYLREKLDDINTVELGTALARAGAATPAEPMTVLLVGTDQREGLDGSRADTIMVLRLDPDAGRAALLSVPRDLWVPIAGDGREQRVNTGLASGPDVLVRTVSDLLEIPIDHYVEVGFEGFRQLVDVVGGVEVAFPAPTRDVASGLHVAAPGCVQLDGDQALALVRSRHFQQLVDGRWVTDPTGDLGRIQRQQAFLIEVFRQVAQSSNPLTLNRLLDVAADHMTTDSALSGTELVELARTIRRFAPAAISLLTLPGTPILTDTGAAVLLPDDDAVRATARELITGEGAPTPVQPSPSPSSSATQQRPC